MPSAKEFEKIPQPLKTRVLVESFPDDLRGARLQIEAKIIAPGKYAESSRLSRVVAVGEKVRDVKPGDVVFSGRYPHSAWTIKWEGRELVSLEQNDLEAIIHA